MYGTYENLGLKLFCETGTKTGCHFKSMYKIIFCTVYLIRDLYSENIRYLASLCKNFAIHPVCMYSFSFGHNGFIVQLNVILQLPHDILSHIYACPDNLAKFVLESHTIYVISNRVTD